MKAEEEIWGCLMCRLVEAGETWGKGSITLIGDAAHPTTPALGQGGCMALEARPFRGKSQHCSPLWCCPGVLEQRAHA